MHATSLDGNRTSLSTMDYSEPLTGTKCFSSGPRQNVLFSCRSCGCDGTQAILTLGSLPLANNLIRPHELDLREPRYPLDLVFCPKCTLVQITETVPPEALFRDYMYFSSYSETMLRSMEALAARLTRERSLDNTALVV